MYATQADNRIIKRPMTDREQELVIKSFKGNQKVMMTLAPVPILLFVVIVFLSNAGDALALTVMYYLIVVIAIVLCALIIAMSGWMFQLRTKTAEVLREGTVVEVRGIAAKAQSSQNIQSYTVGPITVSVKPGESRLIQEGAQVSIACVPRLSIALSANGAEMLGAWIKCPPNLEAMAAGGQAPQPSYPQHGPASQTQQGAPQGYQQQGVHCPSCNLINPQGEQFCQHCRSPMPRQ